MSAYRLAIDQTTRVIDRRAKFYRNLIVAVVAAILGFVVWTIFAWAWRPLLGCLFLFPICGMYFFLDAQLLQGWRAQLLEPWCQRELDLWAFQPAIEAVPSLPPESLRSMLAALPFSDSWLVEDQLSCSTRKAIAQVLTLIHLCRTDILLIKTLALTLFVGGLLLASALWRWEPLLGILVAFIVFWQPRLWRFLRIKRIKGSLLLLQNQVDFDQRQFQRLLSPLSWSPLSYKEKDHVLHFSGVI